MANEPGKNERRINLPHWEGVNAVVDKNLAKKSDLFHVENARSKTVGTIEKREGQTVLGTNTTGGRFNARDNYGLAFVSIGDSSIDGLYRITGTGEPYTSYSISVQDSVSLIDRPSFSADTLVLIKVHDELTLLDLPPFGALDRLNYYLDNTDYNDASIYRLVEGKWTKLSDANAQNLAAANFSHTVIDGKLIFVNGRDYNRYIDTDGTTVVTSEIGSETNGYGSLFNSPVANLVNMFKSRIYLANFRWEGVNYGNSVIQSSLPLGIMALVTTDTTSPQSTDEDHASSFGSYTDLTRGLIAYYPLDGDARDVVGSLGTNDLTENGSVTYDTGKVGEAVDFGTANTTGYLNTTTDIGMSGINTAISLWVNVNTIPAVSTEMLLAYIGGTNTKSAIFVTYSKSGASQLQVTAWSRANSSSSGSAKAKDLGIDSWHHIVVTYEADGTSELTFGGGSLKLYIDGVQVTPALGGSTLTVNVFDCLTPLDTINTGNGVNTLFLSVGDSLTITDRWKVVRYGTGAGTAPTAGVYVGATDTPDDYASVKIDELAFYNRLVTASDVEALYNSGNALTYGHPWKIPVTDTSYFYDDEYANEYEVYRINKKVADVTIMDVDDLSVYAYTSGIEWSDEFTVKQFLSQDQVYPKGGQAGEKKYRWPSQPTLSGSDVKQYGTFKLSGGDESDITMLTNIGNVMLVANRSAMASWNGSTLNNFDLGIGSPSRRGYVKAYGALYFIHYTGVYTTSGAAPTIISSPIQPYLDGATKEGINNAVGGVKGRSVFFAIGDVTLYKPDGSIKRELQDVCLEYNILQQTWYVHTNVKATQFEVMVEETSADQLVLTDNDSHDVKTFLDGTSDDGDEVILRVDTQPLALSANIEDISNPQMIIVESERGSSMQCFISLDDGDFFQIEGQIEKGITRLRVHDRDQDRGQPPTARYMSVSFRDSSKQICKLGRVAVTFVPAALTDET